MKIILSTRGRCLRAIKVPLAAALVFGLGQSAMGAIDLFTTDQPQVKDDINGAGGATGTVSTTDTSILGGFRDLFADAIEGASSGFNNTSIKVFNNPDPNVGSHLNFSNDTGVIGIGGVQWDGDDTAPGHISGLNPAGLGGVDITNGGTVSQFQLETISSDFDYQYTVTAYSDANHWTAVTFDSVSVLSGSDPVIVTIDFSTFTNASLCDAPPAGVVSVVCSDAAGNAGGTQVVDFTNLGALDMRFNIGEPGTPDIDLRLGSITTVATKAALGDRVWEDRNADGMQDCSTSPTPGDKSDRIGDGDDGCSEPGIPDVVVNLYGPDCDVNSFLQSTTTDVNGFYAFTDLDPGQYCVEFDKASANNSLQCDPIIGEVKFTQQGQGSDGRLNSDANTATGQTTTIALNAGDNDRSWDAGLYCPAKIGDRITLDENRDNLQNDPEPAGLAGQTVELIECVGGVPGAVKDSVTTDSTGMYMFNPLDPGEYAVRFSKPAGHVFSDMNQGNDDSIDCDADVNGLTSCVALASNQYNDTVDACVQLPPEAGLGDFVWEDKNVNGIQDVGEPGIVGATVNLLQPGVDGECNSDDDVFSRSTATLADGSYQFVNLQPGRYCVEFVINDDFCDTGDFSLGAPKFTLRNQGADDGDSDADPLTGKTGNIDLDPNEYDPTNDAGVYCPAKIGDRVWQDTNSDGLQDVGESGVAGVVVELFDCGADGVAGTSDDVATGQTRTTDSTDGKYMFGAESGFDLSPGAYYVKFIKPSGEEFTMADKGDDSRDSDCMGDGVTSCVTLGSRDINLTRDCGIVPPPPLECDLVLDKTCRVSVAPPASFDKCDGKLQQFSVTWPGGPISVSGLPNDAPGGAVATGQTVTFFGPFSQNDVIVDISGAVSGQSKFHMSCSDDDFNSPDDCGKLAGNGKKSGSGFINDWTLAGFVDSSGNVLDCGSATAGDFPTQQSCEFRPQTASCDVLGKPKSLTFRYTGKGCTASDNDQPSKHDCSGDVNGSMAVTIMAGKKGLRSSDLYDVSTTSVEPNGEFTISASKFAGDSEVVISNAGGTEQNIFHTSCSVPLNAGDVFGSLELVGFNGEAGDAEVLYGYEVTNFGDPLTNVTVVDNLLGPIAGPLNFAAGQTERFTKLGTISGTTTNEATASGTLSTGMECTASDQLTVERK